MQAVPMQAVSAIPRPALILGWLGVLPFAALALSTTVDGMMPRAAAADALVLYAAIILSFMGGAQWGLAMVTAAERPGGLTTGARLAVSVLPALAAFGLWFLPAPLALLGLAAMFVALLAYDIGSARAGAAPAWYPALRIQLTGAVVLCLGFAAGFGGR
jgi:hypothetical protein